MAEYLYSMFKANGGLDRQQQQPLQLHGQLPPIPQHPAAYGLDFSSLMSDSSSANANNDNNVVSVLGPNDAARFLWKKSAAAEGGKQIHFHPCYFNAVSCF